MQIDKKIKVLVISDALHAPSGVGTQTKYVVDFLIKSGKFQVVALAGAMKHQSYQPVKFEEWGDDVIMYPVDGYGNQDIIRQIIRTHKVDILWFMTDPRFYEWLWMIENEIRPIIPMVYYHVWDNYPYPLYNKKYYNSNDVIVTISKLTDDIVKVVSPNVERIRIPHTVDPDIFKPMNRLELKRQIFGDKDDRFVVFFNSRNARRKLSGTLIFWFKEFLNRVGRDKAIFLLHCDPLDPNGQDLNVIIRDLGLTNGEVMISNQMVPQSILAQTYNAVDVTTLISHSEGYGLCLRFSTVLFTENKCVEIKDIEIGEKVLSSDGKYHEVTGKTSRFAQSYKVRVVGVPDIVASDNHPFYVYDQHKNEYQWKRTDELKKGDKLCSPVKKLNKGLPEYLDLVEWIDKDSLEYDDNHVWLKMAYTPYKDGFSITDIMEKYDTTKHYAESAKRLALGKGAKVQNPKGSLQVQELAQKLIEDKIPLNNNICKINRFIKIDDRFMNLMGWYLAEGSNSAGDIVEIDLHTKEEPIAIRLGDYMTEVFGARTLVSHKKNSQSCRVIANSRIMAELFAKLCGNHCNNKRIHPLFYNSANNLGALIRGLFNGDGYGNNNAWKLTTTSPSLAFQTQDVLAFVGIHSTIKRMKHDPEKGNFDSYLVSIFGVNYDRLCEWSGLENKSTSPRHKMEKIRKSEDFVYYPVISVEKEGEEEELYDICVKDSHNFVANGIVVHNSIMESLNCGTPALGNQTGGISEQITDGKKFFGKGIRPIARPIVGNLEVPYIYEDYINEQQFVDALVELYKKWKNNKSEYFKMGMDGHKYMRKNYNFENIGKMWVDTMLNIYEKFGSWETRKGYQRWEMKTL